VPDYLYNQGVGTFRFPVSIGEQNVLQALEIKNFESHEHTVLSDFSSGLNLICGKSNSGKTSILRALKLVCFNEFITDSVRVGEKFCEITLTTDKGIVRVRRGKKINQWEVTPNGQKTKLFENIGKELLQDVIDITGLRPVTIGNISFNANIMDQLEGHFLLDELNGDVSSGSTRAQVVDEISGLSGIEGIVREISLDNLRNGKDIKRLELEANGFQEQMHDKLFLAKEEDVLNQADEALAKSVAFEKKAVEQENFKGALDKAQETAQKARGALAALPDVDKAIKSLDVAQERAQVAMDMSKTLVGYTSYLNKVKVVKDSLSSIPNTDAALVLLGKTDKAIASVQEMEVFSENYLEVRRKVKGIRGTIESLPEIEEAILILEQATDILNKADSMNTFLVVFTRCVQKKTESKGALDKASTALENAEQDVALLMESVDICPFCQKPVEKCSHNEPVRRARRS
jgi:predicted ATP-dependent endonuclease of OLD family